VGLASPGLARGLTAAPAGGAAGDGAPLASEGLASLLELEIRTQLGRPHLNAEVRDLIARISHENPLWGSERIRGELLKLGIVVSNCSIRRYRWCRVGPGDHQRWRTFLGNQLRGIWGSICSWSRP
jgi:hypothetical protein